MSSYIDFLGLKGNDLQYPLYKIETTCSEYEHGDKKILKKLRSLIKQGGEIILTEIFSQLIKKAGGIVTSGIDLIDLVTHRGLRYCFTAYIYKCNKRDTWHSGMSPLTGDRDSSFYIIETLSELRKDAKISTEIVKKNIEETCKCTQKA